MAIVSRRRYSVMGFLAVLLVWAVITSTFWTNRDIAIQSGDGPLLIHTKLSIEGNNHEHLANQSLLLKPSGPTSGTSGTDPELEELMQKRTQRIADVCRQRKKGPVMPYEHVYANEGRKHLIYNDDKKIIYCFLPKVANTNFRRVFLGLEGAVPMDKVSELDGYTIYFLMQNKLKYLYKESAEKQTKLMSEYRKFLVVREPLERLLSGYRNKFFHPNKQHQEEYHNRYLEFYQKHPNLKTLRKVRTNFSAGPLRFEEFLVYYVDCFDTNWYLNEHFVPEYLLCHPCDINFDYIGKYESINRDTDYIFQRLGVGIKFPGKNDNYSSVSTTSVAESYYKPVSSQTLKEVMKILSPDYTIFGYQIPEWFQKLVSNS